MEKPQFSLKGLRETSAKQYALRFVFGGTVAVLATLIARAAGPVAGGLFLAFPAILPATLTLVGERDGRECAFDDARGACVGSVGLAAFAGVLWLLARTQTSPVVPLLAALATWAVVATALWWVTLRR
ncbi:MAG: DUF3147 family protein [Myxococcota bacterium]